MRDAASGRRNLYTHGKPALLSADAELLRALDESRDGLRAAPLNPYKLRQLEELQYASVSPKHPRVAKITPLGKRWLAANPGN